MQKHTSFQKKIEERILFYKSAFQNPLQIGALTKSSQSLARMVSGDVIVDPDSIVVELGPGTGPLTKALLERGVLPHNLYVVELDPDLVIFLRENYPNIHVIEGDVSQLDKILPKEICGRVSTVVSGIPLLPLPQAKQRRIIQATLKVMTPQGRLLQYTYSPFSSIPGHKYGLRQKRIGLVLKNMPPASVWRYEKDLNNGEN